MGKIQIPKQDYDLMIEAFTKQVEYRKKELQRIKDTYEGVNYT